MIKWNNVRLSQSRNLQQTFFPNIRKADKSHFIQVPVVSSYWLECPSLNKPSSYTEILKIKTLFLVVLVSFCYFLFYFLRFCLFTYSYGFEDFLVFPHADLNKRIVLNHSNGLWTYVAQIPCPLSTKY